MSSDRVAFVKDLFRSISIPESLDVLLVTRGLAALLGVWWFVQGSAQPVGGHLSLFRMMMPSDVNLQWMFLFYAGYRMTTGFINRRYSFTKSGILNFYRNYGLRMLPIYWAISFIGLLLASVVAKPLPPANQFLIREILLVQWDHIYSLTTVFWAVGLTTQFMLICPLWVRLIQLIPDSGELPLLLYAGVLVATHIIHAKSPMDPETVSLFWAILHFQAGITLAFLEPELRKRLESVPKYFSHYVLGACLAFWVLLAFLGRESRSSLSPKIAFVIDLFLVTVFVLHWLGERTKWKPGVFGQTAMYLGLFGFSFSAWARILVGVFPWAFADDIFATIIGGLALSFVTYVLVEKPCINIKIKYAASG